VNGHVRLAECDTHRLPASGQGFVQALLSIEVIRDQLPVNPSSVGDRTNPRPRVAMLAELDERRVQDALPGTRRVALAILTARVSGALDSCRHYVRHGSIRRPPAQGPLRAASRDSAHAR
jgi:hypothetical protein